MSIAITPGAHGAPETEHLAHLESLYADRADPWDYARSTYELTKYSATLAALPRERYGTGLEIGSSIGVFTEQAAPRIDHLLGIDLSENALAQSRDRCAHLPGVSFRRVDFIHGDLGERFDVIFCSEVLYYVQPWQRMAVARKIAGWLAPGGDLILVHARREATRDWQGMYGDGGAERMHRLFSHALGMPVVDRHSADRYEVLVLRAGPSAFPAWKRRAEAAWLTLRATGPQIEASLSRQLRPHPRIWGALRSVRRFGANIRRSSPFG